MRYAVNELMMDGKISLRYHSPAATTVRRTLFLSLKTSTVWRRCIMLVSTENALSPDFNLNEELY